MKNQIALLSVVGMMFLFLNGCVKTTPQSQSTYIGAERAKNTALQEAGISSGTAAGLSADLKTEDGQDYYEIRFDHNQRHYIYHIDPLAGTITSRDVSDLSLAPGASGSPAESASAAAPDSQPEEAPQEASSQEASPTSAPQTSPESVSKGDDPIGAEKAKSIALAHAGQDAAQVSFVKVKQDWENGFLVYDVEFYADNGAMEYDYEIDAYTGTILSYDHDAESGMPPVNGNTGSAIGEAEAKNIALGKIPGATDAHIDKFKTDYDDGRMEYKGEIRYNGMEYKFEIDAFTGEVLSWEAEHQH